jgi:hypothetical protein
MGVVCSPLIVFESITPSDMASRHIVLARTNDCLAD